jgi:hypothetical protein
MGVSTGAKQNATSECRCRSYRHLEESLSMANSHLPSGDSVEFTFRAVDPASDLYAVALYKSNQIIVERVVGEPAPKTRLGDGLKIFLLCVLVACVLSTAFWKLGIRPISSSGEKLTTVKSAGCDLRVVSFYDRYGQNLDSPWRIKHRIFNAGTESCVVQSEQLDASGPFTIGPGAIFEREIITEHAPYLADFEVSVGTASTTMEKTHIQLYVEK